MTSQFRPRHRRCFRVAIICALPREADAIILLFDHVWDDKNNPYGRADGDTNTYTTGRIGHHDVVLAVLPSMGTTVSAAAAANIRSSYTEIKLALIVGICGGLPKIDGSDAFLGDVVISNAIIRYDFGRQFPGHYAVKHGIEDNLGRPNPDVRGLIATINTEFGTKELQIRATEHLKHLQRAAIQAGRQANYQKPEFARDELYPPEYRHVHRGNCGACSSGIFCDAASKASCIELECDETYLVTRSHHTTNREYSPQVFIGRVGSGNTVIKSGEDRDQIAKTNNVIAFEMEGAGVWDQLPCIVVKGICDYADSHKNKQWQYFASATSAAVAKAMLDRYTPSDNSRRFDEESSNSVSQSITYRQPAQAVVQEIPYPRNEDVIDRPDIVSRLDKLLPQTEEYNSAALWGLGGSGKTQIALNFAYQRCKNPNCSVFWVHADSEATFSQDYKNIAQKLGLDVTLKNEDLLAAVREGIKAKPQWVLIIDNADDLTLFGAIQTENHPKNLYKFLPQAPTGTVLWTSRDERIVGTLVGLKRGIEVARMEPKEALALLESAWNEETDSNEAEAYRLLEELQRLPLAISQAAAYMRRTSTSVKEYLSLLTEDEKRWKLLEKTEFDRHRRRNVPNSVLKTWTISIERLQQESEMAYNMLNVIAHVDNQNIPHEIMAAAITHCNQNGNSNEHPDDLEVTETIAKLTAFSFIRKRQMGHGVQCYEMHKLVQEATLYSLSIQISTTIAMGELNPPPPDNSIGNSGTRFSGLAVEVMLDLFPWPSQETWALCENYLAHALQVSRWAETCGKILEVTNLLEKVSILLYGRGRWKEKEPVDKMRLQLHQRVAGDRHPDTIRAMANLASTYHAQGYYSKAEAIQVKVLDLRQEILGERHPDTIWAMENHISNYYAQGYYSKAEAMQIKVLDLRQEILGERHPDTIWAMENLALTYYEQGYCSKAEAIQVKVLDLRQEILGERHPDTIWAMENLASTYYTQGYYSKAEAIQVKVLDLRQEILGERHPYTLRSKLVLSWMYYLQGRHDEAEVLNTETLYLCREVLGEKHPYTIHCMIYISRIYSSQCHHDKAETMGSKALSLCQESLEEKHPITHQAIYSLAVIRDYCGRHYDAHNLMQQCFESRSATMGPDHPHTKEAAEWLEAWRNKERTRLRAAKKGKLAVLLRKLARR